MREKTFERPTARKILSLNGIDLPEKITPSFISDLMQSSSVVNISGNYERAVKSVESLNHAEIALFSENFRVSKGDSNKGIKSLDYLVKIDSQQVLRNISGLDNVPNRLTRQFLEEYKIWPYTLIKEVTKSGNVENPPIGFYWVGLDGHVRSTTWIRCVAGAEMQVMRRKGDFSSRVKDKTLYGKNLRVKVGSRTEQGKEYEFTLSGLPIHKAEDIRQYSDWVNISHNSNDPDASYIGLEHGERIHPFYFWSASTIFSFFDAMVFVGGHKEWDQFRINPFPIPVDKEMVDYVDNLRLRSLILREENGKPKLSVLNKSEMDRLIGARTVLRDYDNCWYHWRKKDTSYLYTPS